MDLNNYQKRAMQTCMDSCENISYMLLNLQAEVGELSGKFAKAIRKGHIIFNDNDYWLCPEASNDDITKFDEALVGELGDVLWQLAGVCSVIGYDLNEIAEHNLAKLADREKRGVIDGNGDYR